MPYRIRLDEKIKHAKNAKENVQWISMKHADRQGETEP